MSLIKQAEEIIKRNRQEAEALAERHYEDALKVEVFADIERQYRALIPALAKSEALGIPDPDLQQEYASVVKKRKEVMAKYGIKEKSFLPAYTCKKCSDTGYFEDKTCICLKQAASSVITSEYGIDVLNLRSFEESDIETNPVLKSCLHSQYDNMQKYCRSFPDTKYRMLIFSGTTGTGKTRLASCMAKQLMERGFSVIFITAFKMNEIFLKYHLDFKGDGRLYLEKLYKCDFLILDDLGTENTLKNVTNEYLLSIISERIITKKHTVVTTNLDSEQIRQKYDDRMHSRLTDKSVGYTFNFAGEDLRQLK